MHRKAAVLVLTIIFVVLLSGCSEKLPSAGEKHPYKRDVTLTKDEVGRLADLAEQAREKDRELDSEPLVYSKEARTKYGFSLKVPKRGNFAVDSVVSLKGKISPMDGNDYLMVTAERPDGKRKYFIPVRDELFNDKIVLPFGEGEYRISLFVPDTARDGSFEGLARFRVYNVNREVLNVPDYTRFKLEYRVSFEYEPSPVVDGSIRFKGSIDAPDDTRLCVITTKNWIQQRSYFTVKNGLFDQTVVLSEGTGEYRVVFMAPRKESEDWFYDVAIYEVSNIGSEIKDR